MLTAKMGVLQPGSPVEPFASLIALGLDRLAAKDADVEGDEHLPVVSDHIRVNVACRHFYLRCLRFFLLPSGRGDSAALE